MNVSVFVHAQLCPTVCDLMDYSLPGSSVQGIFQTRILEWVAISFCSNLQNPGIETVSLVGPALAGRFLPLSHLGSLECFNTLTMNGQWLQQS